MEVKVNKEIRSFSEAIFFGLSLRQFLFSLLAVGIAVMLYFLLRNYVGTEEVGWMCILAAFPFAAAGFFRYQDMPLEQFVKAWLISEFIRPKRMVYIAQNDTLRALRLSQNEKSKGGKKHVPYR